MMPAAGEGEGLCNEPRDTDGGRGGVPGHGRRARRGGQAAGRAARQAGPGKGGREEGLGGELKARRNTYSIKIYTLAIYLEPDVPYTLWYTLSCAIAEKYSVAVVRRIQATSSAARVVGPTSQQRGWLGGGAGATSSIDMKEERDKKDE